MKNLIPLLILLSFGVACGDDDSGRADTGVTPTDAGTDTPIRTDAGDDAGITPTDAGNDAPVTPDAGDDAGGADAGDDAGTAATPAAMFLEASVASAAESCACTFEADEYPTVETCTGSTSFSPAARECFVTAGGTVPALDEVYTCLAGAYGTYATCLSDAACDEPASDACLEALFGSFEGCPSGADADFAAVDAAASACLAGAAGVCPDSTADAGSMGAAVFTGLTVGGGNDRVAGDCTTDAPDRAHVWVAPAAGDWVIDTLGSDFDTILAIYDDCDATVELTCNDDGDWGAYSSQQTITLTEGQSILIVIDGYDTTAAGNYVVNINPVAAL